MQETSPRDRRKNTPAKADLVSPLATFWEAKAARMMRREDQGHGFSGLTAYQALRMSGEVDRCTVFVCLAWYFGIHAAGSTGVTSV